MNDQPVSLTPIALSDEERASALENASHVTPELIGELVPYEPSLIEADESARLNFDRAERLVRTVAVYRDQPIDCSTPQGLEAAKQIRFRLMKLRTRSEALRLEGNEPYRERIEANNVRQKKIEDFLLPIEQRYDDAIKAAERAARERKQEAERKAAEEAKVITDAIAAIRARGTVRAGSTAAEIAAAVIDLTSDVLDGDFFKDRYGEAVVAKEQAIFALEEAQKAAETSEARDKLLKDQAEEIARRDAADAERKAADDTKEAERQAHDDIRQRIAAIRGITAWAIRPTTTAAEIKAKQEELGRMVQSEFDPFALDAMAAHDEVSESLPTLLALAEERERTQQEKQQRDEFAAAVERNVSYLRALPSTFENKPVNLVEIESMIRRLQGTPLAIENFGDRLQEAKGLAESAINRLKKIHIDHVEQGIQAEKERREREAEAADKAAATARQNRMTRALAEQCMTMHAALLAVRADRQFLLLSDDTIAAVQAPLDAIAKAQEGGAA